jgi:hypothetical protein
MKHLRVSLLSTLISVLGCTPQPESIDAGALYSVDDGEGFFRVAKVLIVDSGGVHIRLYKNRFETRPKNVDFSSLSLGSIHEKDGFGMGHLPLTHRAFREWDPVFIGNSPVGPDELEGFNEWKLASGGYFGDP